MSCKIHLRNLLEWPGVFIILFHLFLWDSFPARVLAGLRDSTLDLYKRSLFTKGNNVSKKSRVTRKNGHCFFFYRKDKAKICLSQQNFLLSKLKLEIELNELWCLHSFRIHYERVQYSAYQHFKAVYDPVWIKKVLKLGEYCI